MSPSDWNAIATDLTPPPSPSPRQKLTGTTHTAFGRFGQAALAGRAPKPAVFLPDPATESSENSEPQVGEPVFLGRTDICPHSLLYLDPEFQETSRSLQCGWPSRAFVSEFPSPFAFGEHQESFRDLRRWRNAGRENLIPGSPDCTPSTRDLWPQQERASFAE